MTEQDNIQELIDASEDELLQRIIDRQEGALGQEEQGWSDPLPTSAELARWKQALTRLEGAASSAKTIPTRKRFTRIALLAILAAGLLLVAASALYYPLLNWVESVHERYTQVQAGETAESEAAQWTNAYVPEQPPDGYTASDAEDLGDMKYIEYANAAGSRIMFYQYGPHANVRIDTEKADRAIAPWVNGQTAYLFQKDTLCTLYWSYGNCVLSVEYDSAAVLESVIKVFAEGIQWKPEL